jgi:hypothetical protein
MLGLAAVHLIQLGMVDDGGRRDLFAGKGSFLSRRAVALSERISRPGQ